MNKKGVIIFEIGLWIVRICMVIMIIIGVILQIRAYVNSRVDLGVAEPAIIAQILSSMPAVMQKDTTGNYVRAISVDTFKKTPEMGDYFDFGRQRHAAAKIVIAELNNKEIAESFVNKKYYEELEPQAKALWGRSAVSQLQKWPVMLVENNIARQGIIWIQVVEPA
jgi:hypothetical protein